MNSFDGIYFEILIYHLLLLQFMTNLVLSGYYRSSINFVVFNNSYKTVNSKYKAIEKQFGLINDH